MAGINVNVSVDELKRFADYISNFAKYIDSDCQELRAAVNALASTMDEDSIAAISSTVNAITKIVTEQEPELNNLQGKVINYAEFVARLKAAANGG